MRRLTRIFAAFGLLSAAILLPPPVSFLEYWNNALTGVWGRAEGDTLVVLGAEEVSEKMLGLHSYWRMVYAVYEWRQGHFKTMILSGAGIAPIMKDYAVAHGVPAEAIRLEERSNSTREQAEYVAAMRPEGRVVLVTSDYHSHRAASVFLKYGLNVEPHPVPDVGKRLSAWQYRWEVFADLGLETVKTAYYRYQDYGAK